MNKFKSSAGSILFIGFALVGAVNADSVSLSESQKDAVKCGPVTRDPDTGEILQDCVQNTTGSYSVTAKVGPATFLNNGIVFTDLNADTEFGITIGSFAFSGSLSTANKSKLTKSSLVGTWLDTHEGCAKYDIDGVCTKPKQVTDGTVKISGSLKGATITLSGKTDTEGNGQTIYTGLCDTSASGTSTQTDDASISIGGIIITAPIQITCKVKLSTKDPDGLKGGPFDLINMAIKAKLVK